MKIKVVLGCFLVLALFFSYQKISKSRAKKTLRHEIKAAKNITLEGESGYWDVDRWVTLRKAYKKKRVPKGIGEHLRLAEVSLNHDPLSPTFREKVQHPPKWMTEQIKREFASYSSFSYQTVREMLRNFQQEPQWEERFLIVKYKIYRGRLYLKDYTDNHSVLKYMNAALCRLLKTVDMPDMEFLITFHDSYDLHETPAPLFVFCKKKDNHHMILIPDHELITGYDAFNALIDKSVESSPWENKEAIAYWRGSTSSGDYSLPHWRDYPRSRLVYLSLDHPKEVDARFSKLVLGAESNKDFLSETQLLGEFVYPQDSLDYKYQVDVDGNASTYSHYYWLLRSNCVPLKQESPFMMWYYGALKPYEHYIPIKNDLSDLPDQVRWARTHDEEARHIAERGAEWVKNELTLEDAYLYLYLVLMKYQSLQTLP